MNILFVSHETVFGGATLSLLGMIDELKKENNVYVLVRQKRGPFIEQLRSKNVSVIYAKYYSWLIPQSRRGIKGKIVNLLHRVACGINYIQGLRLRKEVQRIQPDIIHSNTSVINMGAILSELYHIPHIWHIREFGEEDFGLSCVFSEKYRYRFMERHSDRIICVSRTLLEKYSSHISNEKLVCIYNGVSFEPYKVRQYVNKSKYNLLISGRLSEAKGQIDAMKALSYLKRKGISHLMLHLAGGGNIGFYRNMAEKLNIKDQVKFYGHINYLTELREKMDIELICSKKEAFGRVTVEAMGSGVPVIGANSGGTVELIKNKETGLLYCQGDYRDLSEKICQFIENAEYRKKIAESGCKYARKNFGVDINAKKVYQCYRDIGVV